MKKYYSLKKKDFYLNFTEEQRKILNFALERYKRLTASELVKLSHLEAPYLMTEKGGIIDIENIKYNDFLDFENDFKKEEIVLDLSKKKLKKIEFNLLKKYG